MSPATASSAVSRWMSGYDKYYNGMSKKIDSVFQIKVGIEDGLLVLKNWLYNHLVEDEIGGIACFYSDNPNAKIHLGGVNLYLIESIWFIYVL